MVENRWQEIGHFNATYINSKPRAMNTRNRKMKGVWQALRVVTDVEQEHHYKHLVALPPVLYDFTGTITTVVKNFLNLTFLEWTQIG